MNKDFALVHVHSTSSLLDSLIEPEELAEKCLSLNISAVALLDHRTTSGWPSFDKTLRASGVKPLLGLEPEMQQDMQARLPKEEVERKIAHAVKEEGLATDRKSKNAYVRKLERDFYKAGHISLIAATSEGVVNLNRISTAANVSGWRGKKPYADFALIKKHGEGVIVLSGCSGSIISNEILSLMPQVTSNELVSLEDFTDAIEYGAALQEAWVKVSQPVLQQIQEAPDLETLIPTAYQELRRWQDAFGDRFYGEIMPNSLARQSVVNLALWRMSQDLGFKLVASLDAHYLTPEDSLVQEVFLCLNNNRKWTDPNRFRFHVAEFAVLDRSGMAEAFHKNHPLLPESVIEEALDTTVEIAHRCDAELPTNKIILPKPQLPAHFAELSFNDSLTVLVYKGWLEFKAKGKLAASEKVYQKRIDRELKLIKEKDFSQYLLVVAEILRWCRQNDIACGPGRGSSSGSLVCFLIGITGIDPIRYDLVLERFMDVSRSDTPDIDIDVADVDRSRIKRYLEEVYGSDRVASMAAHVRMQGKAAFRKVCAVAGVPLPDVGYITSIMLQRRPDEEDTPVIEETFQLPETQAFLEKYNVPPVPVVDIAKRLEGRNAGKSLHAAGVVIADRPLSDLVAIERRQIPKDKQENGVDHEFYVAYDKEDLAATGLLKIDLLGLKFLTVIKEALKFAGLTWETLENLDMEDEKVLTMLREGHTTAVFQFETPVMRQMCRLIQVSSFEDLIAANALVRPGASRAGTHLIYAKRKVGQEPINYGAKSKVLEDILKNTYGLILFQEQTIRILKEIGDLPWETVNKLRKAIQGSLGAEAFKSYLEAFTTGALENGLTKREAESLFKTLSAAGSYSFARNHAAPYSMISYWSAWLKCYYPREFLLAVLRENSSKPERVLEAAKEARRLGIALLPPDINASGENYELKANGIQIGFGGIKGMSQAAAQAILLLRDGQGETNSLLPAVREALLNHPQCGEGFEGRQGLQQRLQECKASRHCNAGHVELLERVGAFDRAEEKREDRTFWQSKLLNTGADKGVEEKYLALLSGLDGTISVRGRQVGQGLWSCASYGGEEQGSLLLTGRVDSFKVHTQENRQYGIMVVDTGENLINLKVKDRAFAQYKEELLKVVAAANVTDDGAVLLLAEAESVDSLFLREITVLQDWQERLQNSQAQFSRFERFLLFHPLRHFVEEPVFVIKSAKKKLTKNPLLTVQVAGMVLGHSEKQQKNGKTMGVLDLHDGQEGITLLVWADHWKLLHPKLNGARKEREVYLVAQVKQLPSRGGDKTNYTFSGKGVPDVEEIRWQSAMSGTDLREVWQKQSKLQLEQTIRDSYQKDIRP